MNGSPVGWQPGRVSGVSETGQVSGVKQALSLSEEGVQRLFGVLAMPQEPSSHFFAGSARSGSGLLHARAAVTAFQERKGGNHRGYSRRFARC